MTNQNATSLTPESDELLTHFKAAREHAGFTQKEVEEKLNLRALTIRDYEVGRLKLPVSVAVSLSKLYGVTLDELAGNTAAGKSLSKKTKALQNFESLFLQNSFNIMYLDPVIRAFSEDNYNNLFDNILFEALTENFTAKQKKEVVLFIGELLFALASSDDKISQEEIKCIEFLLRHFKIKTPFKTDKLFKPKKLKPVPKNIKNPELRHFIIWVLIFFANADGELAFEEIEFIEKCAEHLKINKSNFMLIKEKFLEEDI